jgi:hypothetical protein
VRFRVGWAEMGIEMSGGTQGGACPKDALISCRDFGYSDDELITVIESKLYLYNEAMSWPGRDGGLSAPLC